MGEMDKPEEGNKRGRRPSDHLSRAAETKDRGRGQAGGKRNEGSLLGGGASLSRVSSFLDSAQLRHNLRGIQVPIETPPKQSSKCGVMATEGYREVDGYYISAGFHEECVRSALGYKPVPGDVFITSYPKCGTTWMQHIVYNILNGRSPPSNAMDAFRVMPFLELQGVESIAEMPRPGAIKTHMPFRFQPFSKDAKYFYITRNPYDCCVSFFYHTKGMPEYNFTDGTFDEFFKMFIEGKADFGDYFDHLLSWYEHRHDPNVFFLTYEDLKKDTVTWVLKIADFLGKEYGRKLRADQVALDQVMKKTQVGSMKKNVNEGLESFIDQINAIPEDKRPRWLQLTMEAMGEEALNKPMMSDFVRKGVVGDWKSHFSAEQVRRLKERIASKTCGSDVMDLWKNIDLP